MLRIFVVFLVLKYCYGNETIIYATIVYRHGDRTPVDPYPTDPYKNESLWPVKFGELTNTGKKQHYYLGQWFRNRYSHLLPDVYDPSQMHVKSTDVDRTLMSAMANLAGMFPPVGQSIWDPHLLWQPVPVHTVPQKEDKVLSMQKPCKAYDTEMKKMVQSKSYQDELGKYQPLMDYLSAYTGRKIKDYLDINYIYSTLKIEALYNFTLPKWTSSVYPDKMREPACHSFTISTATPILARLKVGPLMKEVAGNLVKVSKGSDLKLSIYSAHDDTVGNILNAMRMFDGRCPSYTATILIELIHDNATSNHFVRISYRNSTDIVEPNVLNIPYCGQKCPLERFLTLYHNLISVRWEKECNIQLWPSLDPSFIATIAIFMIACVLYKSYTIYAKLPTIYRIPFRYTNVEVSSLESK